MTALGVELEPATDASWGAASAAHGDVFSSPPWIRAIVDAFGLTVRGRLAEGSEGSRGFVFADIDDAAGRRRSTLPFSDFCNPLSPRGGEIDWSLVADLIDDDIPYSLRTRELTEPIPDGLSAGAEFAWHGIDLTRTSDAMWSGVASNARQGVRRATRDGAVVRFGLDALEEFHRLHVDLRARKYRMLAQPLEYFVALRDQFGSDNCQLVGAFADDDLIAGVLLLRWRDVAYYKFNASSPMASSMHANDLCMWEAAVFAKEAWGCSMLDLGLSDLDQPGLLRYKQKYATEVGRLRTYRNRAAIDAAPSPARALVNTAVELITADGVPEEVRMDAASRFYRLFC